jgi:hypothetical protein
VKIINEPPKVETKDEKSTIKTEEKKELEKQAANN